MSQELIERLRMEAQIHAQEARTANATIAEIYQLCSGGKGEPGNWHGAEPVRELVRELQGLRAARTAYASEFPANDDGEPDVGSIHQNIRKLKAEAATLKAAQGGVTDDVVDRVAKAIADAAGHGMREKCEQQARAAIAALSAPEPANSYCDAYEGAREDLLDWKGRAQRAEANLRSLGYQGVDAGEPPAQPAERVPEERYRGVPFRVLGKAFQHVLADPRVVWRDNGGAQTFIDRVQSETATLLAASPAPSPARGDGGEV